MQIVINIDGRSLRRFAVGLLVVAAVAMPVWVWATSTVAANLKSEIALFQPRELIKADAAARRRPCRSKQSGSSGATARGASHFATAPFPIHCSWANGWRWRSCSNH